MNTISLSRLKHLFIEYFAINWKRDLSVFGGLFLVKVLFTYYRIGFPDPFIIMVISILLIGISNPLNKRLQEMNYLISPANTGEKLLAKILLVHIYHTGVLVLVCFLGYFAAKQLYLLYLVYSQIPDFFYLSDTKSLLDYRFYLFLFAAQSVFIFSTIYFKKHAIVKILFVFAGLVATLSIVIKYTEMGSAIVAITHSNGVQSQDLISYIIDKYFLDRNIFYYFSIIFFWVLSYFRLRETEV